MRAKREGRGEQWSRWTVGTTYRCGVCDAAGWRYGPLTPAYDLSRANAEVLVVVVRRMKTGVGKGKRVGQQGDRPIFTRRPLPSKSASHGSGSWHQLAWGAE